MKKIFLFLLVFSSIIIPQESNSYLYLKTQLENFRSFDKSKSQLSSITNQNITQIGDQSQKKNAGLAILYSLLLPGMGELYAEGFDSGKYFTIADGLLWGTLAGFNIYGNWQKNNYKSFAQTNGGVNPNGKESEYFANIGLYLSIDEYNKTQELNRKFGKVYDPVKYYWNWKTHDVRKEYRGMWSSSENAYNNVRFAAGALILNRLISAINAVRLVSSYNKNVDEQITWNLYFSVQQSITLPQSFNLIFISLL